MLLLSLKTAETLAHLGSISLSVCCRDDPEQEHKTWGGNEKRNNRRTVELLVKTPACSVIRFSKIQPGLLDVVYILAWLSERKREELPGYRLHSAVSSLHLPPRENLALMSRDDTRVLCLSHVQLIILGFCVYSSDSHSRSIQTVTEEKAIPLCYSYIFVKERRKESLFSVLPFNYNPAMCNMLLYIRR